MKGTLEEVAVDAELDFYVHDEEFEPEEEYTSEHVFNRLLRSLRPAASLSSLRLRLGMRMFSGPVDLDATLRDGLRPLAALRTLHLGRLFALTPEAAAAVADCLPRLRTLACSLFSEMDFSMAEMSAASGTSDRALAALAPLARLEELTLLIPEPSWLVLGDGLAELAAGPAGRSLRRLLAEGSLPLLSDRALKALPSLVSLSALRGKLDWQKVGTEEHRCTAAGVASLGRVSGLTELMLALEGDDDSEEDEDEEDEDEEDEEADEEGGGGGRASGGAIAAALAAALGRLPALASLKLPLLPFELPPAAAAALLRAAPSALRVLHVPVDLDSDVQPLLDTLSESPPPGLRRLRLFFAAGYHDRNSWRGYGARLRAAAACVERQRGLQAVEVAFCCVGTADEEAVGEVLAGIAAGEAKVGDLDTARGWVALIDAPGAATLARAAGPALTKWEYGHRTASRNDPELLSALAACPRLARAELRLVCGRGPGVADAFRPLERLAFPPHALSLHVDVVLKLPGSKGQASLKAAGRRAKELRGTLRQWFPPAAALEVKAADLRFCPSRPDREPRGGPPSFGPRFMP